MNRAKSTDRDTQRILSLKAAYTSLFQKFLAVQREIPYPEVRTLKAYFDVTAENIQRAEQASSAQQTEVARTALHYAERQLQFIEQKIKWKSSMRRTREGKPSEKL